MSSQDSDLIQKAEQLENEAKNALKSKNYEKAISNLLIAKDIYARLGLTGQVGLLIREIVRIKNLKKDDSGPIETKNQVKEFKIELTPKEEDQKEPDITEEKGYELLDTARKQALEDNLDDALYFYDVAYKLFQKLNCDFECKQILWQINELKEYQRWGDSQKKMGIKPAVKDIVSLAMAERRRLKIQSQLRSPKIAFKEEEKSIKDSTSKSERKLPKIFEQMRKSESEEKKLRAQKESLVEIQKEQRKQEQFEKENKLRQLREQKKKEDAQIAQAQELLDKGNEMLSKKNYEEAKKFYNQSLELFIALGWNNQVSILRNEIRNIDRQKKEDGIKQQQMLVNKIESEREFQKNVIKALDEKRRLDERDRRKLNALPIQIKNTLEKIDLLKNKAVKEESNNNFSRALTRYEYILTLYQSIPTNILDLSEELSSITIKIAELKAKL